MSLRTNLGETYTPLYFLSALGAGGLSVSFFIYFMFLIPHPNTPLATFGDIYPFLTKGGIYSLLCALNLAAIIFFAYNHIRLLVWNIKEYANFKKTEAFAKLKNSNAEISLMAIPLTYAMSINVGFVLGAVFVPGLWDIVEYLFPFALLGFLSVGIYALKIFSEYFTRILVSGEFDFVNNNNLSQMIAIFAFAMISVGFAAPGAMSHIKEVAAFGLFFAIFFASIAISLALLKLFLGTKSILKVGISKEASVSLWIMIPILTLLGIAFIRMTFGFSHGFEKMEPIGSILFILTSSVFSLQIMFGLVGYMTMKKIGYFSEYIFGEEKKPSSFAIVCPGVAFFVFGMFFIFIGLVKTGIVAKFGIPMFVLMLPFIYVQYKTVRVALLLNKKILKK